MASINRTSGGNAPVDSMVTGNKEEAGRKCIQYLRYINKYKKIIIRFT
jgi:hypothetical protein